MAEDQELDFQAEIKNFMDSHRPDCSKRTCLALGVARIALTHKKDAREAAKASGISYNSIKTLRRAAEYASPEDIKAFCEGSTTTTAELREKFYKRNMDHAQQKSQPKLPYNNGRTAKQIAKGDQCGPDYSWQRARSHILYIPDQLEAMEDSEATPRQWKALLKDLQDLKTKLEEHIEIIKVKAEEEGVDHGNKGNGTSAVQNHNEEEIPQGRRAGTADPLRSDHVDMGSGT